MGKSPLFLIICLDAKKLLVPIRLVTPVAAVSAAAAGGGSSVGVAPDAGT